MKAEQRLRLRNALHNDYKQGVRLDDALKRIHQQHGKKAVARTTVAKWWQQFANGEAPLTLPHNVRTAVGQLSNSSIELRTATQRADFVIPARNAASSSLNVSSRALDGRLLLFDNYNDYEMKSIFIVDLLYSQTRHAFHNNICLHFHRKRLFREFKLKSILSQLDRDINIMPNSFAFLDTSTFVFACRYTHRFRPVGIALARVDFESNKIELIQQLTLEKVMDEYRQSKWYEF